MSISKKDTSIREYLIGWSRSTFYSTFPDDAVVYYFDIGNGVMYRYKKYGSTLIKTQDEIRYKEIGNSGQSIDLNLDQIIDYMLTHKKSIILYCDHKCAIFSEIIYKYAEWKGFFEDIKRCSDFDEKSYNEKHSTISKTIMEASYVYSTKIKIVDTTSNSSTIYAKRKKLEDESSRPKDFNTLIYADLNIFIYVTQSNKFKTCVLDYIKYHHVSILEADVNLEEELPKTKDEKKSSEYDVEMRYISHC